MAKSKTTQIKIIYGDLFGLLDSLNDQSFYVNPFLVAQYNKNIDTLATILDEDLASYKMHETEMKPAEFHGEELIDAGGYKMYLIIAQLKRIIGRLERQFRYLADSGYADQPAVVMVNRNTSETTVQTNYTMAQLIEQTTNNQERAALQNLNTELEKDKKSWPKLKELFLGLLANPELFIKLLPIILEKLKDLKF